MSHECVRTVEIEKLKENQYETDQKVATLMADVSNIKQDKVEENNWKTRIEEKIDKILWFFLGQSVTLILTVLGGVIIYAVTQ